MSATNVHQYKGQTCNHEKNHLCQLAARRDMGRVKELVKDSVYYCKNCGRAAHEAANLCNPSKK